jgi:ribosomal protein S18 acetylase RimI-like enzyme
LACEGDNLIGQLMITYEWSDWRNGWFWWIQSVYVLPGRRGRGVFKALYKEVCFIAKSEENVVGIRLYVEEHNLNAKKVYESMGMKPAGYEVLEMIF